MAEEIYKGIPRNKIPWGPTIDYEKCIRCGKCVDYCKLGAYEFIEDHGEKKPIVKNPDACVIFCTGCEEQCPAGAIRHPSKEETERIIDKLRRKRQQEKNVEVARNETAY